MMSNAHSILSYVLETDDDDIGDLKDLSEPTRGAGIAGKTEVTRHGRWKVVDMDDFTFLISYLTPVAYLDKRYGKYYRSSKRWSPTTEKHIREWQRSIWQTPEWKNNPANLEPSSIPGYPGYARYPKFQSQRQADISELFRQLMKTMDISRQNKGRLYHVDPKMRSNSKSQGMHSGYGGHLKHKDSGKEGLPRPYSGWREGGEEFPEFFKDFNPDDPAYWDWQQSDSRNQEPHEPDEPQH